MWVKVWVRGAQLSQLVAKNVISVVADYKITGEPMCTFFIYNSCCCQSGPKGIQVPLEAIFGFRPQVWQPSLKWWNPAVSRFLLSLSLCIAALLHTPNACVGEPSASNCQSTNKHRFNGCNWPTGLSLQMAKWTLHGFKHLDPPTGTSLPQLPLESTHLLRLWNKEWNHSNLK